jgi:hypothetical protein
MVVKVVCHFEGMVENKALGKIFAFMEDQVSEKFRICDLYRSPSLTSNGYREFFLLSKATES